MLGKLNTGGENIMTFIECLHIYNQELRRARQFFLSEIINKYINNPYTLLHVDRLTNSSPSVLLSCCVNVNSNVTRASLLSKNLENTQLQYYESLTETVQHFFQQVHNKLP